MDWVWGDDARVVNAADHSAVALGSQATKNMPNRVSVGGIPAKFLRRI
jgi:hypothetical protein